MATDNKQTPATPAKTSGADEYIGGVLQRINEFQENGDLKLPADYSPQNALRSAYLMLLGISDASNTPVLTKCTKESIANALLDMVLKGLNPSKKQCYFIAYGNKLDLSVSYLGNLSIAKRVANVEEVPGAIIYKGDEFEYAIDLRTGRKSITKHKQSFENIDNDEILGAYAIVIFADGTSDVEIMNIKQIKLAWAQGPTKGNSPAHKNFPDQMALKTVKNRAVKVIIGSSNDESLFDQEEPDHDNAGEEVKAEIGAKANRTTMNISASLPDPAPRVELPPATAQQQPPAANTAQAEPVTKTNANDPKSAIQPNLDFDGPKLDGPGFEA